MYKSCTPLTCNRHLVLLCAAACQLGITWTRRLMQSDESTDITFVRVAAPTNLVCKQVFRIVQNSVGQLRFSCMDVTASRPFDRVVWWYVSSECGSIFLKTRNISTCVLRVYVVYPSHPKIMIPSAFGSKPSQEKCHGKSWLEASLVCATACRPEWC